MMGMGGISSHAGGADRLAGKVYLSDGSTAALGAQVLFLPAHRATPTLVAMSDAVGVLQPRGLWYTANGPDASTVIAFLPGSSGAVVQQVSSKSGQPLRLVLPKHNRVSGDLTIGGKAPDGRPGVLRVIATFQGKGYLERYLSVSTTADADGRFSLAGLTSGDYLVQASLDNIWTSAPVQLKVDASGASPVHLAIPSPGAPLQLHLVDTAGKAVPGGSIAVDRIGPMVALWPGLWTADGQGSIVIPTLEAGSHVVRVPGDPVPVRVNIPALPAEPVNLTVKIQPRQKQITEQIDPDNIYAP